MSYETNPILTRLKINKGWKNPLFPIKTLNYSYEILVWFKVYLLLKAYFSLNHIKLLACEMRTSEKNIKILYLSVAKQIKKKKISKSKWKAKSTLRDLHSPISKSQNQNARFLLYLDFKTLRKQFLFSFNKGQKKILSQAWISKPRLSSWINGSTSTHHFRRKIKRSQQFAWKSKLFLACHTQINGFIKTKHKLNFKPNFKDLYQKKLNLILTRTKREIWFLKKSLRRLGPYKTTTPSLKSLFCKLTNSYQSKKRFLEKLNFLYETFILVTNKQEQIRQTKNFQNQTKKKIKHIIFSRFWFLLKKQLDLFQKSPFFFPQQAQDLTLYHKQFLKKTNMYSFFLNPNQTHFLLNLYNAKIQLFFWKFLTLRRMFLKKHNTKNWNPYFFFNFRNTETNNFKKKLVIQRTWLKKTQFLTKTRLFKHRRIPFEFFFAKFIRFRQKNIEILRPKSKNRNNKKITNQYRIPYRYNYRTKVSFLSNIKLKYLIQDFIQQYLAVYVYVKIVWPLSQLKNIKFYRLAFSDNKYHYRKKNSFNIQWLPKKASLRKQYIFIGQMTKHLYIDNTTLAFEKKWIIQDKFAHKRKQKILEHVHLNSRNSASHTFKQTSIPEKKNASLKIISSLWREKNLKKNRYTLLKNNMLRRQMQKRLYWVAKTPYMTNLLPTLIFFAKYLDPQPLAEDLAKILGETKKHLFALKFIEKVLSTMKLKRGIGYRIALIGRANGAKKSRTIYLRKLKQNWSRQTFSKNVNFGCAQARATIGAFGVKIWVYF